MQKLNRSSIKWQTLKRKPGKNTIFKDDFEIMTDEQHCYYLCKKIVQTKDKTGQRREFIARKDQIRTPDDLNHACFIIEGDITKYFKTQEKKEKEKLNCLAISLYIKRKKKENTREKSKRDITNFLLLMQAKKVRNIILIF